jgi:hypothetical protein
MGIALFRDLQALGVENAALDLACDERPALARSRASNAGARTAGWIGAGLGVALYVLVGFVFARHHATGRLADGIYFAVLVPLLLALMARAAWGTVRQAGEMAAAIDARVPVDLCERVPVRLAGRVALRGTLVWIVGISIGALIFLNPDFARAAGLVIVLTLVIAGLALVIPVRGVRQRIRAAKRAELARIEAALPAAREAALAGSATGGRLADLLAWRAQVASVSEWPFDASIYRRFALYLLIPLGSWLAGALVERLVNRILD